MQSRVQAATANKFAESFYKALVARIPIYQAVQLARVGMERDALGIPVLYWIRHQDEEGTFFPEQSQNVQRFGPAIGSPSTVRPSVRCAWCGKASLLARKCSFKSCRAQLCCPKCERPVCVPPSDTLSREQSYECENPRCRVEFDCNGNILATEGDVAEGTRDAFESSKRPSLSA
jgi:hypothetical protein